MTILLAALSWLKSAFSAIAGVVVRYPWQCFCVLLLCLSAWLWHGKRGALDERDAAMGQVAQIIKASEEAERLANAAREATEQRYRDLANAIDKQNKAALADAASATDRYISLHKVAKCPASKAIATAGNSNPESSIGPGEASDMVAVTDGDIRICTENTVRLESAREWAAGLNLKAD